MMNEEVLRDIDGPLRDCHLSNKLTIREAIVMVYFT
jgi:hypothetical protein